MISLATSAYQAGRLAETSECAERAIEYSNAFAARYAHLPASHKVVQNNAILLRTAHGMAGIGDVFPQKYARIRFRFSDD